MQMQRRKSPKIQMTCNKCRGSCAPQAGDWHQGASSQIFLCRQCELSLKPAKVGPRVWNFETGLR